MEKYKKMYTEEIELLQRDENLFREKYVDDLHGGSVLLAEKGFCEGKDDDMVVLTADMDDEGDIRLGIGYTSENHRNYYYLEDFEDAVADFNATELLILDIDARIFN